MLSGLELRWFRSQAIQAAPACHPVSGRIELDAAGEFNA